MAKVEGLYYSDEALNIVNFFYGVEKMMYVEGEDDVVFWESILDKLEATGFKVQSVGGKEELKKNIDKIAANEIDSVAAKDLDFSILDQNWEDHPKVISTYGHSIENSMICQKVISKAIRTHGRMGIRLVNDADISSWLVSFHDSFQRLVLFDAANDVNVQKVSVLGDNCTKFMTSQKSHFPSTSAIDSFILNKALDAKLSSFLAELLIQINVSGKQISDFMRGHFLFSAVLKFINNAINKSASYDGLFSSFILAFESVFNPSHPHYNHYLAEIDKVRLIS